MKKDLIIHEAPKSPVSEAIRTLRTSITYKMTKTHDKVFLITSSSIEEGKSWIVSNLAIAFTQSKQKVLIIDADLQEDPNAMIEMVKKYNEGYDIVYGVRTERIDKFLKKTLSSIFYKIMNKLGSDTIANASEYRLVSNKVVTEIKKYNEKNLYLRGIIASVGFSYTTVNYKRVKRFAGETKYPLSKLIATAFNGITTTSLKPLRLILIIGVFAFFISIFLLIISIFSFIIDNQAQYYWLISFIISLFGSLQILSIGIVGEYISKIFKDTQGRPLFIIEEYKRKNY